MEEKTDILNFDLKELGRLVTGMGEPAFRAKQIMSWLYKPVDSFQDMTNLPGGLIKRLEETCFIYRLRTERKLCSASDGTIKYLFKLNDGEFVESVFMRYRHGNTVCISTQVGCRMGCRFCASTLNGKVRDLVPSEMLGQVDMIEKDTGEKVSNVVLMGMGEPLDNYSNVLKFIRIINMPEGRNMGMRHISLSTCGLVDKMKELMAENLQINLSVSLHAPNDEIRKQLMPVANKWGMKELLDTCREYAEVTGRRVHFEYTVVSGVNDSEKDARELATRLRGMLCHVNLIPVNPVKERKYGAPDKKSVQFFCKVLNNEGICATIRRTLGEDVDASCGQLRQRTVERCCVKE